MEGCLIKKDRKQTDIAKRYLSGVMRLHKLIERKSAEKAVLEDQVRRTTASMNPAASFGSSGQDKVGEAVVEIVYLDNEIARYKAERSALRKEIGAIVERLEEPQHIEVISMLYLEFKDWIVIGEEMGCTARNAQNIHGKALIKFAELMQERGLLEYTPEKGYRLREG